MKKLKNLKEAEYPRYEDIFGSDLFGKLQARSRRKYQRDITDNPRVNQKSALAVVQGIMETEKGYEKNLSDLAVTVVKEQFPSLDYLFKNFPFKFDAKIATPGEISTLIKDNIPSSRPQNLLQDLPPDEKDKIARIKNAITQGASVKEVTFEAIEDAVDVMDPELLQNYKDFMTTTFSGMYQSEENVKTLMKFAAQGGAGLTKAGFSMPFISFEKNEKGEPDYDKLKSIEVVARGITFPVLVHEAVKGLFALLQTQGSDENEDEEAVVARMARVGTLENEPRDLQIGQLIYESLREVLAQYDPKEDRLVRILFIKAVFELERKPKEFLSFITNLLDENLTTAQLQWCETTIADLKEEAKRFEAEKSLRGGGSRTTDLDETLTKPTTEATMNTTGKIADYTPAEIKALFDKIMNFDEGEIEEIIKKQGSKYTLYSHSGKKLGTHPSKEAARNQERAIYANKAKNESKSCSCGCNTCGH